MIRPLGSSVPAGRASLADSGPAAPPVASPTKGNAGPKLRENPVPAGGSLSGPPASQPLQSALSGLDANLATELAALPAGGATAQIVELTSFPAAMEHAARIQELLRQLSAGR